jgi:hypothetical protein
VTVLTVSVELTMCTSSTRRSPSVAGLSARVIAVPVSVGSVLYWLPTAEMVAGAVVVGGGGR